MSLLRIACAATSSLTLLVWSTIAGAGGQGHGTLRGVVESGGAGLVGYEVSLYARVAGSRDNGKVVGRANTDSAGRFAIDYELPRDGASSRPILLVRAERGSAMLASAIGVAPVAGPVVVNERTTVATGFAFAQFVDGATIDGNKYGMQNAVRMAAPACAGNRLLKFYPWGENYPGSPYFGGGLSGAGWGITIAPDDLVWVGNFGFAGTGCKLPDANSVSVFRPDGKPLVDTALTAGPIDWPQGTVADRKGNMDVPCPPDQSDLGPATSPSIALFVRHPDRKPHLDSPFTGGGITLPWGIAIDGNDTVWVANFGFPFDLDNPESAPEWTSPNRVSHFCGVDTSKCPPTKRKVGKAISPDGTGYTSDALVRNTGIAVDPSGNVWLTNNWKPRPLLNNPGGNSIAVMVGVAAPVKTPLIGTPQSPANPRSPATTTRANDRNQ